MPRPSRVTMAARGVGILAAAGLVLGAFALGHAVDPPSPTTTVTGGDGQEVVLDWADFPGYASQDPEDVLAAPRAEEVQDVGEAELRALQASVGPVAPELDWAFDVPDGTTFEPSPTGGGNGYGGPTLHWVYNSPTNLGTGLGQDADWHAIAAALDAELAELGYEPIAWDFDRQPYPHQTAAERDAEIVDMHGSLDPDEMWMWSGSAFHGSMWVSISIWDQGRDGAPVDPWYDSDTGVSLFLGGTIIPEHDEQAYADGVAPFDGLARPEMTHSD